MMAKLCEEPHDCKYPLCECQTFIGNINITDSNPKHGDLKDKKAKDKGEYDARDFSDEPSLGYKIKKVLRPIYNSRILSVAIEFIPSPFRRFAKGGLKLLTLNDRSMDKPRLMSKSVWSAIIIAVTAVLEALGVDVTGNPELMQSIYHMLYGLAGAFGIFGLRDALGKNIKMQQEDK